MEQWKGHRDAMGVEFRGTAMSASDDHCGHVTERDADSFVGDFVAGAFYFDNIRAVVPEPDSGLLMLGLTAGSYLLAGGGMTRFHQTAAQAVLAQAD